MHRSPHTSPQRQVAKYLAGRPALWQQYAGWLATLHPELWEEIRDMGTTRGKKSGFHLQPVIAEVGLKNVIEEVGLKNVIEEVGAERVIAEMGLPWLLSKMTTGQRRELKRLLEQ